MKQRSPGFLAEDKISHDSEQFDYIAELHGYLWDFVRLFRPGACGNLSEQLDSVFDDLRSGRISMRTGTAGEAA